MLAHALKSKDMSLHRFVQQLRHSNPETFKKLEAMKFREKAKSAAPKGAVPDASLECVLCGALKHEHKWKYRRGWRNMLRPQGSSCFSCVKASELLGPTRSPDLIDEAGARHLLLAVSARKRQKLGDGDVCSCFACKSQASS